jgi:hypothetical protein
MRRALVREDAGLPTLPGARALEGAEPGQAAELPAGGRTPRLALLAVGPGES